ncbi:MAG: hypothetical protein K2L27_01120 [Muribaculaceae bacterium]|nr:hypothetical protein [Muribaculaceae bacterium]
MNTPAHNTPDWQGYTLRELRYRRAAAAARVQADRIMLSRQAGALRRGNPVTRSWNTMRDVFSIVGYANSAVLAFQLFRRLRGLWRTLRR